MSNNKMSTSSFKKLMIKPADFNPGKFSFDEVNMDKDKKKSKSTQLSTWAKYNYGKDGAPVSGPLVIKTVKPIHFEQGGVPRLGEFHKDDKSRSYVRIPYDPKQEGCVELFSVFEKIDEYMVKNRKKLFTGQLEKFEKMYDYTPIVRSPQESIDIDDDSTDKKEKQEKFKYAKIKLNTDYETSEVKTVVFAMDENNMPQEKNVVTVDDLCNEFPWRSSAQFVISLNNIWLTKSANAQNRRTFGITFKVQQIAITSKPSGTTTSAKNDFKNYAFGADDDEEIVEVKQEVKKQAVKEESESESESEDEKPVKKTSAKKEESESESEESESEESEDEKPVKKASPKKEEKKDTKKKSKKEESESESEESESEDSEEEEKKKKAAAKKPASKKAGK